VYVWLLGRLRRWRRRLGFVLGSALGGEWPGRIFGLQTEFYRRPCHSSKRRPKFSFTILRLMN
jgi:hypothetical protein